MSENKMFAMVAKTFQGLEDVLERELIELGAQNVRRGVRMVEFDGDTATMYRANLCCRTALRILKPICKFSATNPDELYDAVRDFEWDSLLDVNKTFCIDSTVNSREFPHSQYVTYRVKDGIVDYFYDKEGKRPSIRLTGADLNLNVHISGTQITISLDSSGEVLSKRGYRQEQTEAPINEALAAGIILKTGWDGETPFVDPMCGSGTFLIEAALIAANINPGIYRKNFAFEKWPDFDAELFEEIYNDDSKERECNIKIYGADISPEAVLITRRNIRAANVENMIEVECKDFSEWTEVPENGILVTNPPYGERLRPTDIRELYHSIGTTLKQRFKGYKAWIIGYDDENFKQIGLRPSVRIPMLNGSLECELREYVMFDGKMDDYRREGGTLDKENRSTDENIVRVKHLSDKEWEAETLKFGGKRRKETRGARNDKWKDRPERGTGKGRRFESEDFKSDNSRKKFGKRREDRKDDREQKRGDRERQRTRGEERDFKGRKPFKSFNRNERAEFDGFNEKGEQAPWERSQRRNPKRSIEVMDKAPQISDKDAYVVNKTYMRRRHNKQNDENS